MSDTPYSGPEFQIDPDILRQIQEVIDRDDLLKGIEGEVDEWIAGRAHELLNAYIADAYEWFARAIARYPENEPISDRHRMFIWVVANRLNENAPKSMTPEQFYSWTFGLLAMGYMMRMDHEQASGNESSQSDALSPDLPTDPQPKT